MRCSKCLSPRNSLILIVIVVGFLALNPMGVMGAVRFTEVQLGDASGAGGKFAAKSAFTPETAVIMVIAELEGVQAGAKITGDMLYQTPEGPIKALTTTLDAKQAGNLTATFRFSKPTKGWPQGDYKIVISMPSGEKQEVSFKVE